jgi:hypothetical protein
MQVIRIASGRGMLCQDPYLERKGVRGVGYVQRHVRKR